MDRRQFNRKTLLVAFASAFSPLSASAAYGPFWFMPFWPPGQQKKSPKGPSDGNTPGNSDGPTPGKPAGSAATPGNGAATPGNSATSPSIPANAVNVRTYGAKGDGKANDTDAFKAASDEINKRDGGVLYIPAGTYMVGKQVFAGVTGKAYAYQPQPIIEIKKCSQPVTIMGEAGTKLIAAAGLKFGAFDPVSGQAFTPPSMPFTKSNHLANAYVMVNVHDNADVTITNLELDGNIQGLVLGGQWGDTGRQCRAIGILALQNQKLAVKNVHTHHHGQDGIEIGHYGLTPDSAPTPVHLVNVVSEYNARQGLSWVGGVGLVAINCKFNHTGTVRFSSAPAAGLDIEAENSVCRQGYFYGCEFTNNTGCCIVADSGDSAHMVFERCTVWGVRNWSIWPRKPYLVFKDCAIHGAMVNLYADASNMTASCRLFNCTIDDFPHPQYGPVFTSGDILIDMGGTKGQGVVFQGGQITATHGRSFYTINSDPKKPITIKNTILTHCGVPPRANYVCALNGVYLENVHFKEAFPTKPKSKYRIAIRNSVIGPNVVVDGPVAQAEIAPHVGTLPQGAT